MSDHDELKWECASCTYLNYPSAILCTMCRSSKNHSSPCINEPPSTSGDDWKKFDARNERWSCSACTYLNVLKARTCSVCSSKRPEYLNSKPELEDTPQIGWCFFYFFGDFEVFTIFFNVNFDIHLFILHCALMLYQKTQI